MNLIFFADLRAKRCLNFLWSVCLVTLTKGFCVHETKKFGVGNGSVVRDERELLRTGSKAQ